MLREEEIKFAARVVHLGLVAKADMEATLRDLKARREQRLPGSLADVLVARKILAEGEVQYLLCLEGGPKPRLEGFTLQDPVGQGGMSTVFRARDQKSGRTVALKVLSPHLARRPLFVERFQKEARLLIRFEHPNVVKGFELKLIASLHCFAMEFVDGPSVLELIEQGKAFTEEEALDVILQAARAVEYLNSQGIVHRDIKPGNLLVGRGNRIKLCDLGLAREQDAEEPGEGVTVGTVQYISPEQAQGVSDLDVRADIYSLGVTLYHIVMGEVPFSGEDEREILAKQILESLQSPRAKNRKVSPLMHYFIEKMMAKERDIRYQSPSELIRDIEDQMRGRQSLTFRPEPPAGPPRPGGFRFPRR